MEGKTVILSVLILSLVIAQHQVDAKQKSCCPSTTARNIYNACRAVGTSQETCAKLAGCTLQAEGSTCPISATLQDSDAGETVTEAVAFCAKSCSALCTMGSIIAALDQGASSDE